MDAVDASPPCLVDLPRGVLDQIFLRIARADVKRVSLVNRRFRLRIRYYLFQKVHGMWAQFLQLRSLGTRPEWLNHIREIPILSPEASYEHLRDALSHVADNLVSPATAYFGELFESVILIKKTTRVPWRCYYCTRRTPGGTARRCFIWCILTSSATSTRYISTDTISGGARTTRRLRSSACEH